MKKLVFGILMAVMVVAMLPTLSSEPKIVAQENSTTLSAVRVAEGITDPLSATWNDVQQLVLPLVNDMPDMRMTMGVAFPPVAEVSLQAVYTDDTIYIRAVWADDSQSNNRSEWTYTEAGWVKNSYNEDRLALMFGINAGEQFAVLGCGAVCHTATDTTNAYMGFEPETVNTTDMWHWKASRGAGFTDDQWVGPAIANDEGVLNGRGNDANDGGGVANNVNEAGDAPKFFFAEGVNQQGPLLTDQAVEITADMTFEVGQTVPYYVQSPYLGSRGDIPSNAIYVSMEDGTGYWYLVMSRAFNTGNPDDVVFNLNANYPFGIAVFNQVGDEAHNYNDGAATLVIGE
jgi:hypothetical protein